MNPFSRLVAAVVGAIVEAWSEVRVHRGRVLLSLIGVGVAVTALTVVVAAGGIAEQSFRESSERQGGRAATLTLQAYTQDGSPFDTARFGDAVREASERYDISYLSEHGYADQSVRFVDGTTTVAVQTVDRPFAEMHRLDLMAGSWFSAADETRLAPALVVNQRFWERLGSPDLRTHPTVVLRGEVDTVAVVVGVTPSPTYDTSPSMYMLAGQARALISPEAAANFGPPQYEAWVPEGIAEDLRFRLVEDVSAQMGDSVQVDAYRADYAEQQAESLAQVQLLVGGIALLVLLLGALGLVNIALVTVRARIREIGIRRTFGATASRVFFAVMMESVVATVVAGIVGVMLAVLLVKNPITEEFIGQGVSDVPPFPVDAALIGLLAATVVGALAGLLPALVAVRVKVIDAIRY
ncbi:ABC transporter permease [Amnibacterium flavum]|uniref:ABC transporter permease n=1 Tax=Amnibacterium flavum TaxID=2173173 RepID=A0A2V1HLK5_9MICO|nr:ABC transporter permease [Amnibacterium flavum]PVZ93526.1 ABC transporter permease [Amnibacterium flavum]